MVCLYDEYKQCSWLHGVVTQSTASRTDNQRLNALSGNIVRCGCVSGSLSSAMATFDCRNESLKFELALGDRFAV